MRGKETAGMASLRLRTRASEVKMRILGPNAKALLKLFWKLLNKTCSTDSLIYVEIKTQSNQATRKAKIGSQCDPKTSLL